MQEPCADGSNFKDQMCCFSSSDLCIPDAMLLVDQVDKTSLSLVVCAAGLLECLKGPFQGMGHFQLVVTHRCTVLRIQHST